MISLLNNSFIKQIREVGVLEATSNRMSQTDILPQMDSNLLRKSKTYTKNKLTHIERQAKLQL